MHKYKINERFLLFNSISYLYFDFIYDFIYDILILIN